MPCIPNTVRDTETGSLRPADHPTIKSAVPQAWLAAPVIEAMMTTLKKLLGQSLPDVDGKVIEGLLTDEAAR